MVSRCVQRSHFGIFCPISDNHLGTSHPTWKQHSSSKETADNLTRAFYMCNLLRLDCTYVAWTKKNFFNTFDQSMTQWQKDRPKMAVQNKPRSILSEICSVSVLLPGITIKRSNLYCQRLTAFGTKQTNNGKKRKKTHLSYGGWAKLLYPQKPVSGLNIKNKYLNVFKLMHRWRNVGYKVSPLTYQLLNLMFIEFAPLGKAPEPVRIGFQKQGKNCTQWETVLPRWTSWL